MQNKLLIVTSFFPQYGKETYLIDELEELSNTCYVKVLPINNIKNTKINPSHKSFLLNAEISFLESIPFFVFSFGKIFTILLVFYKLLFNRTPLIIFLKLLWLTPKALRTSYLINNTITHIHAYSTSTVWPFSFLVSRLIKTPLSSVYHSSFSLEDLALLNYNRYLISKSKFLRTIGRRVFNSASVISPNAKNIFYLPLGIKKINFFAQSEYQTRFKTRRFLVLGVLQPHKGHLGVLHALKLYNLNNSNNPLYVDFVGSGKMLSFLKQEVLELKLEDYVCFIGQIDRKDILKSFSLNKYSFIVSNSISYYQIHEGVPYSLLEAMSFGLPVIASGCGGTFELASKDGCLIFHEGDLDELLLNFYKLDKYDSYVEYSHKVIEIILTRYNAKDSIFKLTELINF